MYKTVMQLLITEPELSTLPVLKYETNIRLDSIQSNFPCIYFCPNLISTIRSIFLFFVIFKTCLGNEHPQH